MTNGELIRSLNDEDLAAFLNACSTCGDDHLHFCRNLPECNADLEKDTMIPLERFDQCLLLWLTKERE